MPPQDPPAGAVSQGDAMYDYGSTTVFTHRNDPRFAYTLYVPPAIRQPSNNVELVVAVHGTDRGFIKYRDAFAGFARWNNCAVLCPLFPVGVLGDNNRDGYKHLLEGDIRYDRVLLDMVEEVGSRYVKTFDTFALFGFSGGGQFVNRFAYLHPERLWAASIGAPGSVTLLDVNRDWWVGLRGIEQRFGKPFDREALQRVPVQMVVGKADLETWEITHREGRGSYMPGANDAGATRPERLRTLRQTFETAGVKVQFDELPNIAHNSLQTIEAAVLDFFATVLSTRRSQ
ncbi:alpha/beta hydrolase [Paraburkholderia megapolitana]|uniref:alpha/beta hydrolase n=1 Tax=Paraburkholderia megapolitana TaxID=420953 RepID=UPI0038B86253